MNIEQLLQQKYEKREFNLDAINKYKEKNIDLFSQNNIIHVAGTNGKGSTISMLKSILMSSNKTVGVFTSPHLIDPNERISFNDVKITKKEFKKLYEKNKMDIEECKLTPFEALFVIALQFFFKKSPDYILIETGLGGRLDATNTIDKKDIAIITNISDDHSDMLGNTLDKIAIEKLHIANKADLTISLSDKNIDSVFEKYFTQNNIQNIIINEISPLAEYTNLKGIHQKRNASLAILAA